MRASYGTSGSDRDRKHEQNPVSSSGQPDTAVAPKLARLNRDRSSKAVFQCREPVEHLVRFVLSNMKQGRQWLQRMDFSTLQPLPTETIDAWLQAGYQDVAWRLKVRASAPAATEWLRVLIVVEFQSTVEYDIALRVQGYIQRMHEQAWKQRQTRQTDRLPPVLAVVFYNGASPWKAERSVWDLTEKRALRGRDREVTRMPVGMRYELVDVTQYAGRALSQDNIVELMISTELLGKDLEPALVQSILEAQGRLLGSRDQRKVLELLRGWTRLTIARTGVDLDVLEDTEKMQEMQRSGRMLTYIEACAQEYRAELRAQGLQDQRVGLCRQAQRKFGAAAATDLSTRIESINDSAQLWEIGDLIIDCSDAGEFAARLRDIG